MEQKFCTQKEIAQLHQFCNKHSVKYADVREELVDHLASDIEAQWENNSSISFENALQNCYQKFGENGFKKMVREKENAIKKNYRKIETKYILGFFKIPQIFASISITIALFLVIPENIVLFEWVFGCLFTILFAYSLITLFYYHKRWKKLFGTKKILLFNNILIRFKLTILFSLMNLINIFNDHSQITLTVKIIATLYTLPFIVFIIFNCHLLPRYTEKIIKKQYPQLIK